MRERIAPENRGYKLMHYGGGGELVMHQKQLYVISGIRGWQ